MPKATELLTAQTLAFPEDQCDLQASRCPLPAGHPDHHPRGPPVHWHYPRPHFTDQEAEGQSNTANCPQLPSKAGFEHGRPVPLSPRPPMTLCQPPEQWVPPCSVEPAVSAAPGSYWKCRFSESKTLGWGPINVGFIEPTRSSLMPTPPSPASRGLFLPSAASRGWCQDRRFKAELMAVLPCTPGHCVSSAPGSDTAGSLCG